MPTAPHLPHLIILGHGSTRSDESMAPVHAHVAALAGDPRFASVSAAFYKVPPLLPDVAAALPSGPVVIVPFFLSRGHFVQTVIPALIAAIPRFQQAPESVFLTDPVGVSPFVHQIVTRRIDQMLDGEDVKNPSEWICLVAGHGTEKNADSSRPVYQMVDWVRLNKCFQNVQAVFLDEEPRIEGCLKRVDGSKILFLNYFLSDGLHVAIDIPELLGFEFTGFPPQTTYFGPVNCQGRTLVYSRSIGTEPGMAQLLAVLASSWATENPEKRSKIF